MEKAEDIPSDEKTTELEDAAARGKLWEIYVKEAEDYNKGLIESWKADMDNILVFSGLYSAILTAFVIESYQKLQPDPVDSSVMLLKRISQQLATPLDSSSLAPFPDDESFTPSSSALACNILWFISLALALICAFLAILVQQWSRRFFHRISRARSRGVDVHSMQHLYFGLKDLKMHVIVDFIPSLLHLSLFSFAAGLIAFLHDVNNVLTWLFTIALAMALLAYLTFTLLPLMYLGSPYSTPLSPVLWRMQQVTKAILHSLDLRGVWDSSWLPRMKPGNQRHNQSNIGTSTSNEEAQRRSLSFMSLRAVWDWLSRMKPNNQSQYPNEIRTPPNDEESQPIRSARGTELLTRSDIQIPQTGSLSLNNASLQEPATVRGPERITTPLDMQTFQRGPSSVSDATFQESRERRHRYECRCITWTLRSLNDDAELLPFLEVLPHVLLGDNLDRAREGNFHLMDALYMWSSGTPQTCIVSRTLSLMENAKNPWHEEKHRTRCAVAGAKTLYALARVIVDRKYRGRSTYSERGRSLFTRKVLKRISRELFRTPESEPFYNSVIVLCILSIIQSLCDCAQASQPIPDSQFQEANLLLKSHYPRANKTWLKRRWNAENNAYGDQAQSVIQEMISAAFYGYLLCTMRDGPSFNVVHVSSQMMQNGGDFLQAEGEPGDLFFYLRFDFQWPSEPADIQAEHMDDIFCIGFERFISYTSAEGSENDQSGPLTWILDYIATRFRVGGWGSTKEFWSKPEWLLKLLNLLQKTNVSYISALQELLLHTIDEDNETFDSFLLHSLSFVRIQSKEETTPEMRLWFLLVIIILRKFRRRKLVYGDTETLTSILDLVNEKLRLDCGLNNTFTYSHIKDEAHPEVTVILHCLNSKLPAKDTRDVLQLFLRCSSTFYGDMLEQHNILNQLLKHSEYFVTRFLQKPSKEMMDVTALMWSLLSDILPESAQNIEDAREALQAIRLGLISLSNSADKLLSSEGRKAVDQEIKKSTPERNRTILTKDHLKRLNVLDIVERVRERLEEIQEKFDPIQTPPVTLPSSANVDKETELAIDDCNTITITITNQATESAK